MDNNRSLLLDSQPLTIPSDLLNEINDKSLNSILCKCLKGGWLRKWPRSLPLYSNINDIDKCCPSTSIRRWYSCQSRGGSHKRFFWIEQLTTGQWALRWLSNRKRLTESLLLLDTITSISKGCDTEYLDSQTIVGSNLNCVFILSGDISMQLEAESEESTTDWITAISIVTYASRSNLIFPYLKDFNINFDDTTSFIESLKKLDIISNPVRCRHLWRLNSQLDLFPIIKSKDNSICDLTDGHNFHELLQNIITDSSVNRILKSNYNFENPDSNDKYQDFSIKIQKSKFPSLGSSLLNIQSMNNPFVVIDNDKICKLTSLGFHWLLKRPENSIISRIDYHDISDKPLSEFLIASSHNTYLIGDQICGSAEPSGLASALLRGCRCIELDVQDGPDGEPRLYHSVVGYKLSGYFSLRESLEVIKTSAFVTSKLPVILSIQMKSSDPQKYAVYNIFTSILGDSIYIPPNRSDIVNVRLSDLCYKFIIKAKLFPQNLLKHSPGQLAWERIVALEGLSLSNKENIERTILPYHVCSMSENHFLRLLKSPDKISQLSHSCFVRLYPNGTRITSTNFCPLNPWALGIQFVALNYQSWDRSMLINQGWFSNSDGYVPHPQSIAGPIKLSLHILSATQLPLLGIGLNHRTTDDTDLYITISVVSSGYRNESNCVYKTTSVHVKNNAHDPIWADTTPPINIHIERPEYSVLVLQLKNGESIGSGVLIGQASLPIYRILPGIRWIQLLDRRLRPISCSGLLVNTIITNV